MALRWTQDLSVGVDVIDDQHKELFIRVNSLVDAMGEGKGKKEIDKVLKFLEDYVVTHFRTEETYMNRYKYPNYPSHKAEHEGFVKAFIDFEKDLETHGASSLLTVKVGCWLSDWLINHISKVDKAMGAFLKRQAPSFFS